MKLRMSTAKGAMGIILRQEFVDQARSLGITEKEWKDLTGPKPWEGKQRHIVKRLLENLLYGCVDSMGIARFQLPAEFAAAVIASFIYPTNYFAACSWIAPKPSAEEIGNMDGSVVTPVEGLEKATPQQLFALVLQVVSEEDMELMVRRFAEKTEISTGFPIEEQGNETKK